MKRSSGILMPVSSLPSPHGIGTLGRAAFEFVDFLERAGQSWWQILPAGPTSYGDSPYQSPSAFAGNPYFIDLDLLTEEGLLTEEEIAACHFGNDPARVDYGALYEECLPLLRKAAARALPGEAENLRIFCEENPRIPDYALFMALKEYYGMVSWLMWPDEAIRLRRPEALEKYRELLRDEIDFHCYLQYLFFRQWKALREYAHQKGIRIIGDMPLYAALDSSDVWAEPENFQLDSRGFPVEVAGVPPDYFTADGQLWGNPLYNYEHLASTGFNWWIGRIRAASAIYDCIRIDHFRGLESYWAVPAGDRTARRGHWVKGPGMALISAIRESCPDTEFIAEDLGYTTPEVISLLKESGFPGTKVLEFAFDARDVSDHAPHNYRPDCVCYTATHDNQTLAGWIGSAPADSLKTAVRYLGLNREEGLVRGFIRGGMASVAKLFIVQMQDCLELGDEARMNAPGTLGGNWQWRALPGQYTSALADELREMTALYGRL